MMKLIEFLQREKPVEKHKEVSESKFLEILKDNCRNSYQVIRKAPIYLTDKTLRADFYVCTPEAKEIKTAFWVDKLIGEITAWGRFPSRSKFLRGYTTLSRAGNVEEVYVMIPYDMARVGICPDSSFYRSFHGAQKDLDLTRLDNDGLSSWVTRVARGIKDLLPDSKLRTDEPESLSKFKAMMKEIDKIVSTMKDPLKKKLKENETITDDVRKVLSDLLSRHVTTIEKYLDEKLDPEGNGFSSVRVESFSKHHDSKEVWIDKPCLLVKREKYLEMYKQGTVK